MHPAFQWRNAYHYTRKERLDYCLRGRVQLKPSPVFTYQSYKRPQGPSFQSLNLSLKTQPGMYAITVHLGRAARGVWEVWVWHESKTIHPPICYPAPFASSKWYFIQGLNDTSHIFNNYLVDTPYSANTRPAVLIGVRQCYTWALKMIGK